MHCLYAQITFVNALLFPDVDFVFFNNCFHYFFRFWAVRLIKLAIPSAFEHTYVNLPYRIISYRIISIVTIVITFAFVICYLSNKEIASFSNSAIRGCVCSNRIGCQSSLLQCMTLSL